MNLRQLECFVAVAEEGSFTRAAERVGIAQPSLSQHIRALEEELNGAVLTRLPHGAALTPAGRSLLPEARAALRAVERAYRAPRAALALEAGELEIATVLSMAVGLLPGYIGAWHQQYPNVAIRLHEFRHRTLLEDAVEQGVADFAIGPASRPELGRGRSSSSAGRSSCSWSRHDRSARPALDRPAGGARRPGVGALPPRPRPRRGARQRLPPRRVRPPRDASGPRRRKARCGWPSAGVGPGARPRQHRGARRPGRRAAASSRGCCARWPLTRAPSGRRPRRRSSTSCARVTAASRRAASSSASEGRAQWRPCVRRSSCFSRCSSPAAAARRHPAATTTTPTPVDVGHGRGPHDRRGNRALHARDRRHGRAASP